MRLLVFSEVFLVCVCVCCVSVFLVCVLFCWLALLADVLCYLFLAVWGRPLAVIFSLADSFLFLFVVAVFGDSVAVFGDSQYVCICFGNR